MFLLFFFFFSSRRRHTRSLRDWSSDVCSSDLTHQMPAGEPERRLGDGLPRAGGLEHLAPARSEEHTSELQSRRDLVCRLLLEKKKNKTTPRRACSYCMDSTSSSSTFSISSRAA